MAISCSVIEPCFILGALSNDVYSARLCCPNCESAFGEMIGFTELSTFGKVFGISFRCGCGQEYALVFDVTPGAMLRVGGFKPACKHFDSYQEYIQSPEWNFKSSQAKDRAGYRCQICNRHKSEVVLNTHHRTYERLGNELDTDLTVLCRDCHKLYHGIEAEPCDNNS